MSLADGLGVYGSMAEKARTAHANIADEVFEEGQRVKCPTCGRTIDLDPELVAEYLANGWPACHGQTMRLEGPS